METWIILALVYPLMYAIANIFDKFIVDKKIQNCLSLCLVFGLTTLTATLIVLFFVPLKGLTTNIIIFGLLSGISLSIGIYFYFYAMAMEDASRVVSIIYLIPVFVLLFATIFLKESLPWWKVIAVFSAVAGAVMMGVEKFELKPTMRKAFWLVILATAFFATATVIDKYLLGTISFWNVFVLGGFGTAFGLSFAVFSPHARAHLGKALKNIHFVAVAEFFSVAGQIISLAAISLTQVSKVVAISSVQPLYVLILTLGLSLFMPKILKEEFSKKTLLLKVVSVLLIVVGAYFVAI